MQTAAFSEPAGLEPAKLVAEKYLSAPGYGIVGPKPSGTRATGRITSWRYKPAVEPKSHPAVLQKIEFNQWFPEPRFEAQSNDWAAPTD